MSTHHKCDLCGETALSENESIDLGKTPDGEGIELKVKVGKVHTGHIVGGDLGWECKSGYLAEMDLCRDCLLKRLTEAQL